MNDWLVANLNNPDFTVSDFKDIADMSIDNTLFLKKDLYLQSDFIKNNPAFLDNTGTFSLKKFDLYYDTQLKKFKEFTTDNSIPNGLELDVFDTSRTPNSKVKKDNLYIGKGFNPDRLKVGIEGVNIWSAPEKSKAEIAQTLKIFNTATGKYEDYSPDDNALIGGSALGWFKNLFSDPLVMALYDEDTTDPDGTKHYKGEYKLNDQGTYYYETLNGRSPIGKEVLSALDTLTVDGSAINKYDFFDSDDIEKSVGGVIAKNAAALVPIFIGGPVGTVYSTALIAREMAKSMPMLWGMTTALFSDADTPKWMNTIAAMGDKFTSGTSDYAKEHTFSVENFGNMIADVALLWGLLKGIANAFNKLKGSNKYMDDAMLKAENLYKMKASSFPQLAAANAVDWQNSILGLACLKKYLPAAEKAMKESSQLGRDASLAYMAIVSNSDVYGDMLQAGASKKEAAAVALGSTLGMFAVDKYAHLGEVFFDDATEDSVKAARKAIKNELLGYTDSKGVEHTGIKAIINQIKTKPDTDANKIIQIIHGTANKVKGVLDSFSDDLKYHTLGFFGKAAGEGLEEVGEELVTDTAKSIYELAGYLGADTSTKDVGAWDNMFERYTMSFLGGALGGGIFYGVEALQNKNIKRNKSDEELVTLIRNGHVNELYDEVEKLRSKGKLGSRKLSASKWESTTDGDNVWLTTNDETDSLNLKIADIINLKITSLDSVINNNQVGLSDDALFKNMVMGELRYYMYLDVAPITDYYEDFNEVLTNLIKAELDYKTASLTLDGSTTITDANRITDEKLRHLTADLLKARLDALSKLELKVIEARQAKDTFLSGDTSMDYMRKLNFALDPILHAPFLDIDEKLLWEKDHKKPIKEATPEELLKFMTETLPNAQKFKTKEQVTKSWERFKAIEKTISPELHNFTDNAADYKKWFDDFLKVLPDLTSLKLKESYLNWDSKIDTESDEDYKHRDEKFKDETLGIEESDEDFNNRRQARATLIRALNEQKDKDWADNLEKKLAAVSFLLDPLSRKLLFSSVLPYRTKDVLTKNIEWSSLTPELKGIASKLKVDLSNLDEIKNLISLYLATNDLDSIKEDIKKDYLNDLVADKVVNGETHLASEIFTFDDIDEEGNIITTTPTLGELTSKGGINTGILKPDGTYTKPEDAYVNSNDALTAEDLKKLNELKAIFGEDMAVQDIIDGNYESSDIDASYLAKVAAPTLNEVDMIATTVKNNPIVALGNKLRTTIKNPIIEITKALIGKVVDSKTIPDVFKVLNELQDKFETIEDVSDLVLDNEQLKNLKTALDALKMVATFMYAASSTPNSSNVIGHNKTLNEYAAKHSDKITHWDVLPEIDADYAVVYNLGINLLSSIIDYWILLSSNNEINKRKLFIQTDAAYTKSYNAFYDNNRDKFKITVSGKDYNLLEGFTHDDTPEVNLFNYEKTVYFNFLKALADSKLSITDFLEQSKFLDKLIDFDMIDLQDVSKLNPKLTYDLLTEYDKLKYISTILSVDPTDFYNYLKSLIEGNSDKAPIASLEYASRIVIAKYTLTDRDIMNYAYSKAGMSYHNNSNTVVCTGDAGSGKTSVVIKNAIGYFPKETKVLCVGPTETLVNSLQASLGKGNKSTAETLLRKLFGDVAYNELLTDLDIALNVSTHKLEKESKYFELVDGFPRIKKDAITFLKLDEIPNIIVIDEATHIPAVMLLFLDLYMLLNNGTLVLLGDLKQRGYLNPNNGMTSMEDVMFFASRTPDLNVSLRDNNILKLANLNNVKTILSSTLENIYTMSKDDYYNWLLTTVNPYISKLKFRAYTKDSITGDLIIPTLTPDLINKIKTSGSIGFIGDVSSAAYLALKAAGIDATVLSMNEMQGQEFDIVVIDHNFEKPKLDLSELSSYRNFLQDLYTLMSRGKSASIFIDNGLSSIISDNQIDDYTAKAPSLTDKINGESAVDLLKKAKLGVLGKFDLSKPTISNSSSTPSTTPTPSTPSPAPSNSSTGTTPSPTSNPTPSATPTSGSVPTPSSPTPTTLSPLKPEDFKNPDEAVINPKPKETIETAVEEDSKNPELPHETEFTVMSWGDVTYLGVQTTEKTYKGSDGKDYTAAEWSFKKDSEGNLRNLSALRLGKTDTTAFWYKDKLLLQEELYQVKSMLIHGHTWENEYGDVVAPAVIRENFNKEDWENGEYEIEFRKVDNEVMPIFGRMPEVGMDYNGEKIIANIVFKVKNKNKETCIFDLCGLSNPETLNKTKETHKSNLLTWIAAAEKDGNAERVKKLKDILATVDRQAANYTTLFETLYNLFKKSPNGVFSIKLTSDTIIRRNHTWFKERQKPKKKHIRLGGLFDPDNINKLGNDYIDLQHESSNFVFSDVYVYADTEPNNLNIDMSLKGRAVVFVSSDKMLKPDELAEHYINLKQDPEHNLPTVRMITLDNYGMSFNLMLDDDFIKKVQGGDTTRLPYRANYIGLSMFVSMWNYRAALKLFKEALDTWMSTNNYDEKKVEAITLAANDIYYKKLTEDLALTRYSITKDDLTNLKKFNEEACKDIMFFRLGLSNKNGFHILLFNVNTDNYVKKDKKSGVTTKLSNANLLVISPLKAALFEVFLDGLMAAIEPNKIGVPTLGLLLINADTKQPWKENEYINIENANAKNSLSGLITPSLEIQYNHVDMAYKLGEFWSALPKMVSSMVRTIEYFLYHPSEMDNEWDGTAKISVKDNAGNYQVFKMPVKRFFSGDKKIHSVDNTTEPSGLHPDRSLRDMFDMMFHGTLENVHKPGVLKLTAVRFPNGFYINPDIARVKASGSSNDIVSIKYDNKTLLYPVKTNPALFTADVELRAAGLDLDITKLYDIVSGKSTSTVPTTSTTAAPVTPSVPVTPTLSENLMVYDDFEAKAKKCGKLKDNIEETIENMNTYSKSVIADLVLAGESLTLLFTYVKVKDGIIELKSIFKLLLELTGNIDPKIEYLASKVIVDGKELDTNTMTFKDEPKKITTILDTDFNGLPIGEALNTVILSDNFKNLVDNDDWCDMDELESFREAFNNILSNKTNYVDNEAIKLTLKLLEKDYGDFTSLLSNEYDELYLKLFKAC